MAAKCEKPVKKVCPSPEPGLSSSKRKPKPPKGVFSSVVEFPRMLRSIGPKQVQSVVGLLPSALFYGVASFICITYFTDWETVLKYLPYYNGKFRKEVDEPIRKKEIEMELTQAEPEVEAKAEGN